MFSITDSIFFTFDEHRRLRIAVPEPFLPLAAWLYTDVQPNLATFDKLVEVLRYCRQAERPLFGNGCSVDFASDFVTIESLYDTWPRAIIPQSLFWSVLEGLRGFLVNTASEPGLARPDGYPELSTMVTEVAVGENKRLSPVYHTYFPTYWSEQQVIDAGNGAWASPELIYNEETGVWSGMWQGLELAGYYNRETGEAMTYFPVISP